MEFDIAIWLNLAFRWLHLITGIAWIGSSFYFIWLDNHLRPPANAQDGIAGDLWAVHGGGFYHNQKYMTAPPHMPGDLHWFKWEAYFTWISGFLLLSLIYYYGADLFLIDRTKADLSQVQAILIGLGVLGAGWGIYDGLCRLPILKSNTTIGLIWFAVLTGGAYLLGNIFSDRGAFIHIGAMIGTVMAANVFFVIIPNQKKVVAALVKGDAPDPALGAQAKQRSLHNNYMTLPVLFIMISNHYPMIVGSSVNWILLAGLGAVGWVVRYFFNLRHVGVVRYELAFAAIAGFLFVAYFAASAQHREIEALNAGAPGSVTQAALIIDRHCAMCHSARPSHPDFSIAPTAMLLDSPEQIKQYAQKIYERAVITDTMPLGNETGMTDQERLTLGRWARGVIDGEESAAP